jgi:hypothetical protein
MDEHDLEEIEAAESFSGLDAELDGLAPGIAGIDADGVVEVAGLGYNEAGEEFLGAGGGAMLIGVFLVEDLPGAGIEDDDGCGVGERDAIGARVGSGTGFWSSGGVSGAMMMLRGGGKNA